MEKVVVYPPGALVGMKLAECCSCSCHEGGCMHFAPCCVALKEIHKFPDLDENGTPTEKLPSCPNCKEDELGVVDPEQVLCYGCGWELVRGGRIGATT